MSENIEMDIFLEMLQDASLDCIESLEFILSSENKLSKSQHGNLLINIKQDIERCEQLLTQLYSRLK